MKEPSHLDLARFRFEPAPSSKRQPMSTPVHAEITEPRNLAAEHDSVCYPLTTAERAIYRTPAGAKVSPHRWAVYDACRLIPPGRITTYGHLCTHIGSGSARSVGSALAVNPFAPYVPCHRVLPATLFSGGFRGAAPDSMDPAADTSSRVIENTNEETKEEAAGGASAQRQGDSNAIAWNWHDSVKVQGPVAVRREKIRMLELEGVRFGADGRLVGGKGEVWCFNANTVTAEDD